MSQTMPALKNDKSAGTALDQIKHIWVISDGTAGMRLQALALGNALVSASKKTSKASGKKTSPILDDIIMTPPTILRWQPRLARHLPAIMLGQLLQCRLATALNASQPSYPDLLISCGRRMAGTSIALRRLARQAGATTRTIQIQDPRLQPDYFDILITPQHDPARGPNVVNSMASLTGLTMQSIKSNARSLDSKWTDLSQPCIAVLLGGTNRRYNISHKMAEDMADRLASFAASHGVSLALIASRRTPSGLLEKISSQLGNTSHAILQDGEANPYPGILATVKAVIVTSDSVNMASEAAITGKPVLIAEWQTETGRIGAFHDAMMQAGHSAPLQKTLPETGFKPLREMPAILTQTAALLMK